MKGQEWYQTDEVAEGYEDKRFTGGGRLIDERERTAVKESLGPLEGRRVLEVACGTGRISAALADEGADVVGLDISRPMLEQGLARARSDAGDGLLEYLEGDAARLPFPDDAFDDVFAIRFFHLADEPVPFLEEMKRVARETIVFDTFKAGSLRSPYTWLLPMDSRLYSDEEVEGLLDAADLTLSASRSDFVVPYGIYRGVPEWAAEPIRDLDTTVLGTSVGEDLATVTYWTARLS